MRRALTISLAFLFLFSGFINVGEALATSSTSFIIPSDALGSWGGVQSGGSYIVTNMGDELDIGYQSSADYRLISGFVARLPEPVFSFSLDSSTLALSPSPTTSVMSTGSVVVTTSTNNLFGYATTVAEDNNLKISGGAYISDVSDGTVGPAGTEEYGIGLTGSDRAFSDDRPITSTPQTIASSASTGASRSTTVTFKLSISSSTTDGNYSHVVTFISTPSY